MGKESVAESAKELSVAERGEPLIRSAPMPADMNGNGDIFGGWVLSQMDIAGGIVAARRAQGRVVTVAVDAMTFHQPIKVGDIVSIYGRVIRVGRSSMAVKMETIVARRLDPTEIKVTEGVYTYVAIDENGKPRPVPAEGNDVTNGSSRHYAADEIVAPALIALKAWYDEARGGKPMAPFDLLPEPHALPGSADLALIEVAGDGRYPYLAMGEQYRRTAKLKPDTDGMTRETRPVVRQHLDLALKQREAFHVSITRWDGPKILQFDRLILPLTDAGGEVSHLLVGEVFLRVAKPG